MPSPVYGNPGTVTEVHREVREIFQVLWRNLFGSDPEVLTLKLSSVERG